MSANAVLAPPEEKVVEKKTVNVPERKPRPSTAREPELLERIFKGHREFLGLTPD
jgi:hypothetical protein